ncbi:tetratricopeptide repeat protein [Weeksellaceae bacterium A-14]
MVNKIYFLLIFLSALFPLHAQKSYNALIFEGNRAFDSRDYDKASSRYMEAARLKNKDFASHYNLGNALYKSKKYDEALAEYQKAESAAGNSNDKVAASYNMGNAYMQTGKADKAAEYYKKALKQDPYNDRIRKNYEIAMLKQKQQQNQKQQKNRDQNNQNKGKDGKDQDKNKNQNNQNGGQDKQNQGKGDGDQPQKKNDENNSGKMPKDLEDAILNRVKNREQETARKILNKNSYSAPQSNEKDW